MARQHDPLTDTPARRQFVRGQTVARDLDICVRTIQRWEEDGKFPRRVQLGPNSFGYIVEEVEAWKAARKPIAGKRPPPRGTTAHDTAPREPSGQI